MMDRDEMVSRLDFMSRYFASRGDMAVGDGKLLLMACAKAAWEAAVLVKAQSPSVMTLDEIGNALKMPLWKETKSIHKDLYNGWVLEYDIQKGQGIMGTALSMTEPSGRVVWYRLGDYGKTWRCWTARPTDEQRKAVKWDE
jgi:hypothetical protein